MSAPEPDRAARDEAGAAAATPDGVARRNRVPIPAYGAPRPVRGRPGWLRLLAGVAVYFGVLWLVINPYLPLPTFPKVGLGFLLAGMAAGAVARRPAWLAGLLGFSSVLLLALLGAAITLSLFGGAFLLNNATAEGDVTMVGRVRGALIESLALLALVGGGLSLLGGVLGGALRATDPTRGRGEG